jgi:hypothetical protein
MFVCGYLFVDIYLLCLLGVEFTTSASAASGRGEGAAFYSELIESTLRSARLNSSRLATSNSSSSSSSNINTSYASTIISGTSSMSRGTIRATESVDEEDSVCVLMGPNLAADVVSDILGDGHHLTVTEIVM